MKLDQFQKQLFSTNTNKEDVIKGILYNLADRAVNDLGVEPNSPIHLALLKISQDTWDLRDLLEEEGYW
jgi:hypothetical protein